MIRHFLSVTDLDADEITTLLENAVQYKRKPEKACLVRAHAAALLFERPSLRTRTAYEVALMHLGGRAIAFETQPGQYESIADVARTLSQLISIIVARVRDHVTLETLAAHSHIPVVNALSNHEHPVEVLADALTMHEHWGETRGRRLAFIGDGNNICHSLLLLAPLLGMDIAVASPTGYMPETSIVVQAQQLAAGYGTHIQVLNDPQAAVTGADAVYTDVWASMGHEESAEQRRQLFGAFQVNAELLVLAQPDALVLHCLPARRGEEISAEVLDGPQSFAFRRLSNLVPVTIALLRWLLTQ